MAPISVSFPQQNEVGNFLRHFWDFFIDNHNQVLNELIASYLDYTGILQNVTYENSELIASMLEEMGIANAEEIVLAALGQTTESVALQKQFLTEKGYELINATIKEINQFLNEANASQEAKRALAQLAIEKINFNNNPINTAADINNLIALANTAGASAEALVRLNEIKKAPNSARAKNILKNMDWGFTKLNASDFKLSSSSSKYTPQYTPQYTGGSSTNKAIQDAQEDAAKESAKAAKEMENQFEETVDAFEQRVKVLNDALSLLKTNLDNVTGAFAKNKLVDAELGITEEKFKNYSDALNMYTQKANEALSKLPSDIAAKIKGGAVDLTTFIGDGNKDVVEAIKDYEKWADKVADCKQELAELKTAIRQLELDKFNNIVEQFTNQFDLREDSKDLISKQIALLEEAGQLIGDSFFTKQIEQSKKQLELLEAEKKQLVDQMESAINSGRIEKGTDEWYEMARSISDVEGSILDCKKAIEEFNNELLELNWQIFERIQTQFDNISSELGNLAGLFDDFNDIRVSDGKGTWTKEAIATLGLYAQQYEVAKYQVEQYSEAMEKLKQDYLDGRYSATEYMDKLADLSKEQWEAVNATESLEDSIYNLNKTRVNEEIDVIEEEIDAYKKLTNAQIDALKASKDLHDYEKSIAEKNKSIIELERQLAAMQNDNTAATIAKRKQLEKQLSDARKDLEEYEYDHSIEVSEDALNKQFEQYQSERNAEIEALKATLEDKELLISQSFTTVKANADIVGQEIAAIAVQHGVTVSDAIITSWQSGETAIASYGQVLSAQSSAFIGNLIGVENEVYNLRAQANVTADSLAYMFSTRADNLVNELTSSYYSEANLNAMTNALRDSLINTLERGYNIGSITSALSSIAAGADSVANAANRAAQALAGMGAAQTGAITSTQSKPIIGDSSDFMTSRYTIDSSVGNGQYRVIETISGKPVSGYYRHEDDAINYLKKIRGYAKGGIVTKDDDGVLDPIAKAIGEDTVVAVKHGEGILTEEQTNAVVKLAERFGGIEENGIYKFPPITLGQLYELESPKVTEVTPIRDNMPKPVTNNVNNSLTVHYDSLININGDVNDIKHFTGQVEKLVEKGIKNSWKQVNENRRYNRY